jgi:Tfp pilus assembly protein PilN
MAQQINLYSPILLAPRRYFSAAAMALSLGVLALLLAGASAWIVLSGAALQRELQGSLQAQAAERTRLTQALAARPSTGGAALDQEWAAAQNTLAARRALLEELTRGRIVDGHSHAAMLRMVARTVPPSVWLTQIRLDQGRLELQGLALQPDALRPWLTVLADDPLTSSQRLATVKLDHVAPGSPQGAAAGSTESWAFQLVSQAAGQDLAATGSTPQGARP